MKTLINTLNHPATQDKVKLLFAEIRGKDISDLKSLKFEKSYFKEILKLGKTEVIKQNKFEKFSTNSR